MDRITIPEAAREFSRSQSSLYKALADGLLTRYKIPLDRRTYLDRSELERLLQPKEKTPPSR